LSVLIDMLMLLTLFDSIS